VFIPEGGAQLSALGSALASAGFSASTVKVLGTGLWDDPLTAGSPVALGGWYAGVAPETVAQFAAKYRQTYGGEPPRLASLSYDAMSLAVALSRQPAGQRYTTENLTNRDGFQGANGLFRFLDDGRIERGLSVLEVTTSGPQVVDPAPTRFPAGF